MRERDLAAAIAFAWRRVTPDEATVMHRLRGRWPDPIPHLDRLTIPELAPALTTAAQREWAQGRLLKRDPILTGVLTDYDPLVVDWAQRRAAELVRWISDDTRAEIRRLVALHQRGIIPDYRVLARRVRTLVGVLPRDEAAIHTAVSNAADRGMSPERVERLRQRLTARALNRRSLMIARTETRMAQTAGRVLGWRDAAARGLMPPGARREWLTGDAACPRCSDLAASTVPWDQPFPDGDPPLHPNCRCTIVLNERSLQIGAA